MFYLISTKKLFLKLPLNRIIELFLFLLTVYNLNAQAVVSGNVIDDKNMPIPDATIRILELDSIGTTTDFDGNFSFYVAEGKYTLKISFLGFESKIATITPTLTAPVFLKVKLASDVEELDNVVITSKSDAQRTKEEAFEVEVVQTGDIKNASIDINAVLTTVPGINIRQRGGVGSSFDFSLNGLSGKQIKFFIDGVPLENYGNSLSFNNFPATLVERAEIYKGVVPIHLGVDALGGAVNIITTQKRNDFLDVSYDIGSFNTHRATLNTQFVTSYGQITRVSSFMNYADNNYEIDDIVIRDDLGNDTGKRVDNVERFHDAYSSQMLNVQTGFVNTPFADELLLGILASANRNEIQHPIDPQNPFGEVYTKNRLLSGSVQYKKADVLTQNLDVQLYASIAKNREKVVDTSSRKYDWFGNFIERGDQTLGEFESRKTLFEFTDDLHTINTLLRYQITDDHNISLNYTKNYLQRKGTDPIAVGRIAFDEPHIVDKNIFGLAYDFSLLERRLKTSLFTKGYMLNSEGIIEDLFTNNEAERFTRFTNNFNELGYGLATTFFAGDRLQLKGSFEKTFRIPEGYEVFGDGFLLKSNPQLLPETSYNANVGLLFNYSVSDFRFQTDINTFLRDSENFIAIRSEGIFSRYYNTTNARSTGVEGEIRTLFKNRHFIDINATYQNIIDKNAGANRGVDFLQNQRIANIPYLFGNLRFGTKFIDLFGQNDQITLSWNSYYVHDYPLTSFVEGSPEDRAMIPEQLSHSLQLGYTLNEGKYNLSLLIKNITDAKVYDNFEIQQPGRAFYLKLRYYISN